MTRNDGYLKSFYKTYGILTICISLVGFIMLGIMAYTGLILNEPALTKIIPLATSTKMLSGFFTVVIPGLAILGLSKLKEDKICLIDLFRIVGLPTALVLTIIAFAGKTGSTFAGVLYIISTLLFAFEFIFRLRLGYDPKHVSNSSMKSYFSTLATKFNPLLILCVGVVLAVALDIFFKNVNVAQMLGINNVAQSKPLFLGILIAGVLILLLPVFDKYLDVTLIDFILAVLFVAMSYALFITAKSIATQSFVYLAIIYAALIAIILLRALGYTKDQMALTSSAKIKIYFKKSYTENDVVLAIFLGFLAVVFLGVAYLVVMTKTFENWFKTPIPFAVVAMVLLLVLVIFTLAKAKTFKSENIEKVDFFLIPLLFASAMFIPFLICAAVNGSFNALTSNIIVLVAIIIFAVVFIYSAIVQCIRIKNINADPIKEYGTLEDIMAKEQEETEEDKEEVEEEEVVEEEEEEETPNDPFALTEEDEAIYEAVYGKDEETEEEVVEEEVVEEEPVEEEVVEEEVVEVPAEEEVVEDEEEVEEEEETEDEEEAEEEEETEEIEAVEIPKEDMIEVVEPVLYDEEGNVKKIKKRFNTKMMFAPYDTKGFYNEIKNYLQLYRAKGRYSARCESFRYKGLVAKVALGGKSIKVFLAIDPSFIAENPKYHLKDFSEKKQYAEVPVMIKVRSQRALKYFKELVDYMMANRFVKPKRNYQYVDYTPQLIPNGEAIMASLGLQADYLQSFINVKQVPEDMPDNIEDYIPTIAGEPLDGEEDVANVYLDTLCSHFEEGEEVNIDILKSLHIVTKGNVIRIKARGTLDRKLRIYAEYFDLDALKMCMCTSCTVIKIKR